MSILPSSLVIASISVNQTADSVTPSFRDKTLVLTVGSVLDDKLRLRCSMRLHQIWRRVSNRASNFIDWARFNSYRIYRLFFWMIGSILVSNICLFLSYFRRGFLESVESIGLKLNSTKLGFWKPSHVDILLISSLGVRLCTPSNGRLNGIREGGVGVREPWTKSDWDVGLLYWVGALSVGKGDRRYNIFLVGC